MMSSHVRLQDSGRPVSVTVIELVEGLQQLPCSDFV